MNNGMTDQEYRELMEYNLRSIGLNPNDGRNQKDYAKLIPMVKEVGLADNDRMAMVKAAEVLQLARWKEEEQAKGEPTNPIDRLGRYFRSPDPNKRSASPSLAPSPNGKEEQGEPTSSLDRLDRYYKSQKPAQAGDQKPNSGRVRTPLERLDDYYKANK